MVFVCDNRADGSAIRADIMDIGLDWTFRIPKYTCRLGPTQAIHTPSQGCTWRSRRSVVTAYKRSLIKEKELRPHNFL